MCKVLGVPRSSYYKYLNRKPSKRETENEHLEKLILEIYEDSGKTYGAPKINITLRNKGITISIKRTQRLMNNMGIKSIIIKRDFSTKTINEKWVTDITYIHTVKDGWCYLASVMDLHSKKIIGHAISRTIDTELALQAVKNAILLQKPINPLILHSDLGSQYTSYEFGKYISESKILTHSFSGKGCPYDNACIESFHASLKKEEVNLVKYYDFDTARLAIFKYIEAWYNRKRIHSSIGYITPQECEDLAKSAA